MAVFVPTRAGTEQIAASVGEQWERIYTEFYHGGEPIAKLRPFLEGDAPSPVPPLDDRRRAVGAEHPGAGHGGDRGRAVHHRGAARKGRAHAPPARRQRDPADGGARARASCGRRGLDPLRTRHRLRNAAADRAELPARRRPGASGDDVRGHGCARRRPGAAGAARPHRLPRLGARCWSERGLISGEPADRLRPQGRGPPGGSALGRAAGAGGRGADPPRGGLRLHRVAAPDDAGRTGGSTRTSCREATISPPTHCTRTRWRAAGRWGACTVCRVTSSSRRRWRSGARSAECWCGRWRMRRWRSPPSTGRWTWRCPGRSPASTSRWRRRGSGCSRA